MISLVLAGALLAPTPPSVAVDTIVVIETTAGSIVAELDLENVGELQVGDELIISVDERTLLRGVWLLYGVPLGGLLAGALTGAWGEGDAYPTLFLLIWIALAVVGWWFGAVAFLRLLRGQPISRRRRGPKLNQFPPPGQMDGPGESEGRGGE